MSAPKFVVGQRVWYKVAGTTPFIGGDPNNPAVVADNGDLLGGRLAAAINIIPTGALGNAAGVPQILTTDGALPPPLTTKDGVTGTFSGGPQGVVEQVTANVLAPHQVIVSGIFAPPPDQALFNTGTASGILIDEGATDRNRKNTILTIDPNFSGGRSASSGAAVAEGPSVSISGPNENNNLQTLGSPASPGNPTPVNSESVDLKSAANLEGVRVPSSQIEAGIVISVNPNAPVGTRPQPDGSVVGAGNAYQVAWGPLNPSKPHNAKWFNRQIELYHAEEDLVAA